MVVVLALMLVLAMVVVLVLMLVLAILVVPQQQQSHIQLMLKVTIKILTHKSFVVHLLVAYKPIHKTSEFASFNHHQSHPQAHSSSVKFAHLNHLPHPQFAFVKEVAVLLNHPHSFFVNVHHNHQLQLLHNYQLYQFHHDQSSLNVCQLCQLVHVM
jgi:hypothetical protein